MSSDIPSTCEAAKNCDYPIDVTLESSDGRRFGAHKTHLAIFGDAFPSPELGVIISPSNPAKLSESADVLLLMLQFMHNQVHPDLLNVDLNILFEFTEAADKYGMYFALEACNKAVNARSKERPIDILRLKLQRDWTEDIDEVAKLTLDMDTKDVVNNLIQNPQVLAIWVKYKVRWAEAIATYQAAINNVKDIPVGPSRDFRYMEDEECKWPQLKEVLLHIADFLPKPPSIEEFNRTVDALAEMEIFQCPASCYRENDYSGQYVTVHEIDHWKGNVTNTIETFPRWEELC